MRVLGEVVKVEQVEVEENDRSALEVESEAEFHGAVTSINSSDAGTDPTDQSTIASSSASSPASQQYETHACEECRLTFDDVTELQAHVKEHALATEEPQNGNDEPPTQRKKGRPTKKAAGKQKEENKGKSQVKPKKSHGRKTKGQQENKDKQLKHCETQKGTEKQIEYTQKNDDITTRIDEDKIKTILPEVSRGDTKILSADVTNTCTVCEVTFGTRRSHDLHFKTHLKCSGCKKTFPSLPKKEEHTCPKNESSQKEANSKQPTLSKLFRIVPKGASKKRACRTPSPIGDPKMADIESPENNGWELVRDDTGEVVDTVSDKAMDVSATVTISKSQDNVTSSKEGTISPNRKKVRPQKRRHKDENHMVSQGKKTRRLAGAVAEDPQERPPTKPNRKVLTTVETQVMAEQAAEKAASKKVEKDILDPPTKGTQEKVVRKKGKKTNIHENELSDCKLCGATFKNIGHLKNHIRSHKWNQPHICPTCGLKCSNNEELERHEKIHSAEKPYPCKECSASFARKYFLDLHMRTHTGEKPFTCETCGKAFAQSSHLKIHIKTHTGEKPYKCVQCNSAFVYASKLKEHMRTHSGERPFGCKTCDRVFAQKYYLKVHQRTHSGEKPFKCEVCGVGFRQSCHVLIHMRTHTGAMPYSCKKCGKEFRHSPHLKKHTLTGCDSDAESTTSSTASVSKRKPVAPKVN